MPSKRHHAVPRFYLERFAKDDGLVWLHNVENVTAVRVNPKDAIVEKYLYSPEVGQNPKDDSFEKFLAERIEGPAAPCLERLANGEEISSEDRQRIALFIAYQEYRSQYMRDMVTGFVTEIARDFVDVSLQNRDYMKSAFEKMGRPITDEKLAEMTEAWNRGGVAVEATKIAWLHASRNCIEIGLMLYKMPWLVVEAPDGVEFLTSDTPIVKVLTDRNVPEMYAGGWLSPSAESTFALDPRRILVIRPDGKEGRAEGPRAWCKDVNSRLIGQARRFVVSRSRDDYVEKVAKKRQRNREQSEAPALSQ
jgi:hypothetical protein